MAWERAAIALDGERVEGLVKRGQHRLEVTLPWRPGISLGEAVALDGVHHEVIALRDPGGRHEVLELTLAPAEGASTREGRPSRPDNESDRLAAIRRVIAELDLDDPAHVTGHGRPDANALSERLGWRVSARERDQAWKEMTDHDR